MSNKIEKNQPHFERDIFEFKEIARVEDSELTTAEEQFEKVMNNQFVLTADVDGLAMFEKLYDIVPDATDTLDFRRERILQRIQLQPPYTIRFLKQQLDKIIGAGKYTVTVDPDKYEMTIDSAAQNQVYAQEVAIIVGKIKPANIIFVSRPLIVQNILEKEIIINYPLELNYRLGTRWNLGEKPFKSRGTEEVIKASGTSSLTQDLTENSAADIRNIISGVRVNGELKISEFEKKEVFENTIVLEYKVSQDSGIGFINKIELLDESGEQLNWIEIYVPVIGEVLISHKISFKEGA